MSLRRIISRVVAPPLIAGILALQLDGCAETVGRTSLGSGLRTVSDGRFYPIASGSEIEITRRDGVLLRGTYHGTARMSSEEYARHWTTGVSMAGADSSVLPAPGATVEIRPRRGEPYSARLAGFSLAGVELERDSSAVVTVGFADLKEVRAGRWSGTDTQLAVDAVAGRLPLSTLLRIGVAYGEITVPADQVAEVRTPVAPQAGGVGGGEVVAGILVAALLGAALALYVIGHAFDNCGGSPTISSFLDVERAWSDRAGPVALTNDRALASGGRP